MFGTIRKHQTWLWALIIAAVIVSFVIYFTPSADRGGTGGGAGSFGTMDGNPINRKQYLEAYVESQFTFLLRYGAWPEQAEARRAGYNLERETSNRLVLLSRLQELHIDVGPTSVAKWIVRNFGGDQPAAAKARYDNFVRDLRRHNVTEGHFQDFIRHQLGVEHLAEVAGTAGCLIAPRAAESQYRQDNEKVETEAVIFSSSNHLASIQVDPAALAQFYTNRQSVYRTPERVQLNYVRFTLTNYLAEADTLLARRTNLATDIERQYLSSNPASFVDTNGQTLPPEVAKQRLRDQEREKQAGIAARRHAAAFATNLEVLQPMTDAGFVKTVEAAGLQVATTEPFTEREGPSDLKVRSSFTGTAFKLTPQDPVALSPIPAEDGVYLISLKQRIPSSVPTLESIRSRVEHEFIQDAALRLAREAGTNFVAQLTQSLAQGKSWTDVCATTKVTPVALPKFAASSRTVPDWDRRIELSQARAAVATLAPGKASNLILSRDGAFVLHVKNRIPIPDAELKDELPKYVADMRQSEQYQAFTEWFGKQIELSRIDTIKGTSE